MSAHPNVILKMHIAAEGTTRKLRRDLLVINRQEEPEKTPDSRGDDEICIGGVEYRTIIMEDGYNHSYQISGKEGDLVLFRLVTYGYGEEISWGEISSKVLELQKWGIKHRLDYRIAVSANYW